MIFQRKLFFLTLLLTAGCGHDHMCPEGDPEIASFTADRQTVAPGGELSMIAEVRNFEFSGHEEGGGHSHGDCLSGHIHVYLDDLMTNPLGMPDVDEFTITIPEETEPGEHTLIGRLHHADHMILEPQVTAELAITVEAP